MAAHEPTEERPENRRRSPRVPLGVRVGGGTDKAQLALAMGEAKDLSIHGMYVELRLVGKDEDHILKGTTVFLRFRPPDAGTPIDVEGVVRRLDRESPEDPPRGIGVEFINLDEHARAVIADFLAKRMKDTLT